MILRVGVTGGIGSGKSVVCRVFSVLGIPVFNADEEARNMMTHDTEVAGALGGQFGDSIFLADKTLNRKALAEIIFSDANALAFVNNLVHPRVGLAFEAWAAEQDSLYVIKEAALIYEAGLDKQLDKVIVVEADKATRTARVVARDGKTAAEVEAIMLRQIDDTEKAARADFLIDNDGHEMVIPKVIKIHRQLCVLASAANQTRNG